MSDPTVSPTPRRRVLGHLAAAAATLGLTGSVAARREAAPPERSLDAQLDAW